MRYKVSISNSENFKIIKEFIITKFKLKLIVYSSIFGIILLTSLIFILTPVKNLLPGFPDSELRAKLIETAENNNKTKHNLKVTQKYIDNLQTILSGNIHKSDIESKQQNAKDTAKLYYNVSFNRSKADSILRERIENGVSSDNTPQFTGVNTDIDKTLFYSPLKGLITSKFNATSGHFGTDIVAKKNALISAVLEGTVIFSTYSINTGHVIQIQHDNNLISVYKHNSQLLKKVGEKVKKGESIAIIGNTGEISTGPHLHFELWYNGIPLDPEKYLSF